jgi:hypothetical protein
MKPLLLVSSIYPTSEPKYHTKPQYNNNVKNDQYQHVLHTVGSKKCHFDSQDPSALSCLQKSVELRSEDNTRSNFGMQSHCGTGTSKPVEEHTGSQLKLVGINEIGIPINIKEL